MVVGNTPTMLASSYASTRFSLGDAINWRAQSVETFLQAAKQAAKKEEQTMRVVKVIVADPNESIPLDDRVLYMGDEKLTDLTDAELYFELDMKGLLEAHNAKRVKVVDKTVKDRVQYLEPVRIKDLKMVVVNVTSFGDFILA